MLWRFIIRPLKKDKMNKKKQNLQKIMEEGLMLLLLQTSTNRLLQTQMLKLYVN